MTHTDSNRPNVAFDLYLAYVARGEEVTARCYGSTWNQLIKMLETSTSTIITVEARLGDQWFRLFFKQHHPTRPWDKGWFFDGMVEVSHPTISRIGALTF